MVKGVFAQVLGCDQGDTYAEFLETTHASLDAIFSSYDAADVYGHMMSALCADGRLVKECERLVVQET